MFNTYRGVWTTRDVTVNGARLQSCGKYKFWRFSWGDKSQGNAQLALAILCNEFNHNAPIHPRRFMWLTQRILRSGQDFEITSEDIAAIVREELLKRKGKKINNSLKRSAAK